MSKIILPGIKIAIAKLDGSDWRQSRYTARDVDITGLIITVSNNIMSDK